MFEIRRDDVLNAPTAKSTIWVQSKPVHILFDTGATHSFMSSACAHRLQLTCGSSASFVVRLPDGSRICGDREILQCPIWIGNRDWLADFIVVQLAPDDDVILGMNWMRRYRAVLDIHGGTVTVIADDGTRHVWPDSSKEKGGTIISAMKAAKLINDRCVGYLCYVLYEDKETLKVSNIPVVQEFEDVFPEELPGLPPQREVDFNIDLEPGTRPISRS